MIDHDIIDFFVQQVEDFCYSRDYFLKDTPYLLRDRELDSLSGDLSDEIADSLVVAEAFCCGENVVLQRAQCCGCDLGCEVGVLALTESQIGLAILEYQFKFIA